VRTADEPRGRQFNRGGYGLVHGAYQPLANIYTQATLNRYVASSLRGAYCVLQT
jgi:hypothetical protein